MISALDKNAKTFVVHIAVLSVMPIYSSRKVQIKVLLANKTLTKVLAEYLDYVDIFSLDLVMAELHWY